jgi:excisionase family DNA binding protein
MTDEIPLNPPVTPRVLLTVDEVAAILHHHPVTIRRQLRAGTLPGVKHGATWYVRWADLDRLMTPDGGL